MKVAIFGAGAVGGLIGARLAAEGEVDVTLVARGAHLAAMQRHGLELIEKDGTSFTATPRVVSDTPEAGPQDYVVLAVKTHSILPALDAIAPLLGENTAVVTVQNGVPWWYFYGYQGQTTERRLQTIDPQGLIWRTIGPQRAIGCVPYVACTIERPGAIRHVDDNHLILGEPLGVPSERIGRLSEVLSRAGFRAPVTEQIRAETWGKLWGNVAFNPLSALTHGTLAGISREPAVRAFARNVMLEVQAVVEALGEKMTVGVDERIDAAERVGEHKTSMLQDLELGRPLEVDSVISAVVELARLTQTETPYLDALDGMLRLLVNSR